ncbi:MAG: hypothetical protein ACKPKO_43145, partial [Candidatus Fonsibacter sp.]
RTHKLVGTVHVGVALLGAHNLVGPWQADPTLSNLFEAAIWHKTSVVQIIDHSDVFRQLFK